MFNLEFDVLHSTFLPNPNASLNRRQREGLLNLLEDSLEVDFSGLIPEDWQWSWVQTQGEFTGTLTRRFSSIFWWERGEEIPREIREEIRHQCYENLTGEELHFKLSSTSECFQDIDENNPYLTRRRIRRGTSNNETDQQWQRLGAIYIMFYQTFSSPDDEDHPLNDTIQPYGYCRAVPIPYNISGEAWALFDFEHAAKFRHTRLMSEFVDNYYARIEFEAWVMENRNDRSRSLSRIPTRQSHAYIVTDDPIHLWTPRPARMMIHAYNTEEEHDVYFFADAQDEV